jgi:hypothetical protein
MNRKRFEDMDKILQQESIVLKNMIDNRGWKVEHTFLQAA